MILDIDQELRAIEIQMERLKAQHDLLTQLRAGGWAISKSDSAPATPEVPPVPTPAPNGTREAVTQQAHE